MISIYSIQNNKICEVNAKDSSYQFSQIMGDNYVQLDFTLVEYVEIPAFSYVALEGVRYYLPDTAVVTKQNETQYDYQCKFVAPQGLFSNIICRFNPMDSGTASKAYDMRFSVSYKPKDFIKMICENLTQRLGIGEFAVGDILDYDREKMLTFDYMNCYDALNQVAQEFNTEWYVSGNSANGWKINLKEFSIDKENPQKIKYGKGNGVMPNIKRTLHSQSDKATHILVNGGNRNIQKFEQNRDMPAYGFDSLHLPSIPAPITNNYTTKAWDNPNGGANPPVNSILFDVRNGLFQHETATDESGMSAIEFNKAYSLRFCVDRAQNSVSWVRNASPYNTSLLREVSVDLTDIYPYREGTVSAVEFGNSGSSEETPPCYFFDNDLNFDVSKYFINGEVMVVVFQTGALAGKEFKIVTNSNGIMEGYGFWYDASAHTGKFKLVTELFDGIEMPNNKDEYPFRPAVGDKYALFKIALPNEYLSQLTYELGGEDHPENGVIYEGAEWELLRQACIECYRRCKTRYNYTLSLDANWLQSSGELMQKVRLGEWLKFEDAALAPDERTGKDYYDTWNDMRIVSVKTYLNKPMFPEITLGEPAPKGLLATIRHIQSGTAGNSISQQASTEQAQKDLQATKKEQAEINEKVEQRVEIIQVTQTSGGTGGTYPLKFTEFEFVPVIGNTGYNLSVGEMSHQTMWQTQLTTLGRLTSGEYHYKTWTPKHSLYPILRDADAGRLRAMTVYVYAKVPKDEYSRTYDFVIRKGRKLEDADMDNDYVYYLVCTFDWGTDNSIANKQEFFGWQYLSPSVLPVNTIVSQDGNTRFDLVNGKIIGELYVYDAEGNEVRVADHMGGGGDGYQIITSDYIKSQFA